jgi:transposase-like protein
MAKPVLNEPQFLTEAGAFAYVEARLWPNGPVCPFCGGTARIGALNGKTTRPGLYKCYPCQKPFTVRMGTLFEDSHLPLHLWLQVIHLMCASKKGIATRQIQRMLRCSMKTAWFLGHRIREAMRVVSVEPMGGAGEMVEIDETFVGRQEGQPKRRAGWGHKNTVMTLVQRGGSARSFHVDGTTSGQLIPIVRANISKEAFVMSDELTAYNKLGDEYWMHQTVNHSADEYVRGIVHTNTVEGYYSIFKRGMVGVYQHCKERYLHRYLAEFDFRYSNRIRLGIDDVARADRALKGVKGKRLTYQTTRRGRSAAAQV